MEDDNITNDLLEDLERMSPDHFEIAVSHMRLQEGNLVQACRKILVDEDERKHSVIAAEMDVRPTHLSTTCTKIKLKWKKICAEQDLECEPIALPKLDMDLVRALQSRSLELLQKQKKTRTPRK